MMCAHPEHPDSRPHAAGNDEASRSRLHLLLTYGGWREDNPIDQLPHLLKPMGIASIRANSGEQAAEVIRTTTIHIAVVDLAIPLQDADAGDHSPGGSRILQILRRLDQPPPTVVVRPPQSMSRESARTLCDALREGAFAVLDRPLKLETLLETLRRVLRRHYADHWPGGNEPDAAFCRRSFGTQN